MRKKKWLGLKVFFQFLFSILLFGAGVYLWAFMLPGQMENTEFFYTRHGVVSNMQQGVLAIFVFFLFGSISLICGIRNLFE